MDITKRCEQNPLLSPKDLKAGIEGMEITCLLNPGVFRYQGKIRLLLRVAERPIQQEGIISFPIYNKEGKIEVLSFSKNDPDLDASDPRVIGYKGKNYLTTMSYLRMVSSTDGIHFEDDPDASTLPAKGAYGAEEAYRVTRGFAKTMLAKTYMFKRDFASAEKVLREIVETDKDYTLLKEYGMNWLPAYENSSESVFEIANKVYDKTIATGTNVPHFFTSRRVSGYQGYGFHVPTKDLFDAFDPDDPRITYIFTQTGDRYKGDVEAQDNTESLTGFHDYKMTVPTNEKVGFDVWMISYNIRIIRYADVLLMYAETLNENGKAARALGYVNEIRKRARETNPVDPRKDQQTYIPATSAKTLPDIVETNQDKLRKIIWRERRCELAMEGWRRDDLMRQKRFGQVMRAYAAKYKTSKGANFKDERDYRLPIPQGERDKSHNVLSQNPGF